MVGGMLHCAGGPGASFFGQLGTDAMKDHDIYSALETWVEKGNPPEGVVGTKYIDDNASKGVRMTRPLCEYPAYPAYKGSGDPNDQANFTCKAPGT